MRGIRVSAILLWLAILSLAAGCSRRAIEAGSPNQPTALQSPAERVSPLPECNPEAVVWAAPEPPENPDAGDVWVNPRDGMEMVFIPAGEFLMGTSDAEIEAWVKEHPKDNRKWFADQQPQCRVQLPGYWIGRTEVANANYLRFVEATGRPAPDYWEGGKIPAGMENRPMIIITWEEARAYCEWAGGHLPTEAQWEKAARGTDGRAFPWGNQWDRNRCRNFSLILEKDFSSEDEQLLALANWMQEHNPEEEGLAAAGSYPAGASPYGSMDMAGNVMEWCAEWYEAGAYKRYAASDLTSPQSGKERSIRGECYMSGSPFRFRCATRIQMSPAEASANLGFRYVREAAR